MKEPGPDHPITVAPLGKRLRITAGGTVVADTARALALKEARYETVFYVPREDVRWDLFAPNPHRTSCPFKGEASYYDLNVGDAPRSRAVWSYEDPYPAVAGIKEHLAFYPDKVDAIEAVSE